MKTKNKGSEWRKWDLHLHSFYTSINNNFSSLTEAEYIDKIKKQNIEVIGLTNYFNFSEEDWSLKQKLKSFDIVVFLNLELRLTYINKEDECCDIHLVFSDDLEKSEIDTFLTKLNYSISGAQKTLNAITSQEKKTAAVEFSKISDVLNDPAVAKLKEKVLIGMLSRGKGNSRSSAMYASLTEHADFIVHSSSKVQNIEDDIKYWSGNDTEEKPLKFKALFQSSDAHNIDKIGEKYSWVKGNPCFETLRQAVVDYKNRILIQERNPTENKNASPELFIDYIEYNLDKKLDKKATVYFNKEINTVIGKRGAGKSVLLKHIASIVPGNIETKKISKLSEFKMHWCDKTSEDKFIEYIPQNYLSAITYEDGEKYNECDKKVEELLLNNELFKNANTTKVETINATELKVNEKIKDVLNLHRQIVDTENQLKSLGKSASKDEAIRKKKEEISGVGKINTSDEDIENQIKFSSEIESLSKEIKLLEQDIQIINQSKQSSFITVDNEVFLGLSPITLKSIEGHIKELSNKDDVKNYLNKLVDDLYDKIKTNKEKKTSAENSLKPISEKLQQNKTIEKISIEISKLDSDKKEIEKLEKFIQESNEKKEKLINEVVDLYLSFKEKIEGVVQTLEGEFSNFTFITFDFTVSYDIDVYKRRFFDEYIDGRSGERFKKVIDEKRDFNKDEITKIIKDIISDTDAARLKNAGDDKESVLTTLLGCRYDIDFTKSVKYKDGTILIDFENMTGGQKAMALLDLIFNLSKGGYPIIIDQPENDIDVSGISNDLRKLILDQKERRQVIMATHSPNLLLLTDSENVIVAENEDSVIKYHNDGIENKTIQNDIINILEGGKDALRKRMDKLNIN